MKGNCPEISVSSDRHRDPISSDTAAVPSRLLLAARTGCWLEVEEVVVVVVVVVVTG